MHLGSLIWAFGEQIGGEKRRGEEEEEEEEKKGMETMILVWNLFCFV